MRVIPCLLIVAAGLTAGAAVSAPLQECPSEILSQGAMSMLRGGDCPDQGCQDTTCMNTGCTYTEQFCTVIANTTKCRRVDSSNFARCGAKQTGYKCSEVSGAGCVTVMTGDQNNDADPTKRCPEAQCNAAGSTCGSTKYTCTGSTCSS